jgi:geranylgeranyl diphosphate synthase, type II
MDLQKYLAEKRAAVDQALDAVIAPESAYPASIHKAMRYCLFAGGKRLRPILAIAAAEAIGGDGQSIIREACALELIHTYSLVHDDLPAMDNDDFRRGVPTTHTVFGEALAILAGDALLTEAFRLLACADALQKHSAQELLAVIALLAEACGSCGLIGGQVVDLESEGKAVDQGGLDYIHRHKTGALIIASIELGARLANGSGEQLQCLRSYGAAIGLAFQIADDILDVVGSSASMGKKTGSDEKKQKATWPAVCGLEEAQRRQRSLCEEAIAALAPFDEKADPLRAIARYIIERDT